MRTLSVVLIFWGLASFASTEESTALRRYEALAEHSPETHSALSVGDRRSLFYQVSRHPVTDLSHLNQYDPEGFIGYCFGRAMGAHLLARKMGLAADSLRKLFIIGFLDLLGDLSGEKPIPAAAAHKRARGTLDLKSPRLDRFFFKP